MMFLRTVNKPNRREGRGGSANLLVVHLDGVRQQHRGDVPSVGARHGDDRRPGELLEHPRRLREAERRRRRQDLRPPLRHRRLLLLLLPLPVIRRAPSRHPLVPEAAAAAAAAAGDEALHVHGSFEKEWNGKTIRGGRSDWSFFFLFFFPFDSFVVREMRGRGERWEKGGGSFYSFGTLKSKSELCASGWHVGPALAERIRVRFWVTWHGFLPPPRSQLNGCCFSGFLLRSV